MMLNRATAGGTSVGLLLATLLGLTGVAAAQQSRRLPILVGDLQHAQGAVPVRIDGGSRALPACNVEHDVPTAIKKTLVQMGEEVREWPASVPSEQCTDLGCASRLRAVVKEGFLLGGQISLKEHGQTHLDLWLVDLGARRIMLARHNCNECDKPEIVARHAAAVVQRRSEPQAPWFPLAELSSCSSLGERTPEALSAEDASQVTERPRQPILLAVYGSHVPEKIRHSISQGTKQYLELMGQPVQEFRVPIHADAPRSSLRPQEQAARLLDIELQGNDRKTSVSEVLVRLSDVEDTRQTTFQCASLKECTPASLVQQVRLHVGTLMDHMDTPAQAPLEAGGAEICLPVPLCVPSAEPVRPPIVAVARPSPPVLQPEGDESTSQPVAVVIAPPPKSAVTPCPGMSRARKLKLGGWTLIGLGGAFVAAAIAPTVLSTVSSKCVHMDGAMAQLCDPPPPAPPNLWPIAGVGYGLGALSIGGGIGLLALSRRESKMEASQGGTTCPH